MNTYPLFVPPPDLVDTPREDWSKKQADKYFSWLTSSLQGRVNYLLNYLSVDTKEDNQRKLIENAVQKFEKVFDATLFCNKGELTNVGYAISADMGLLVAQSLVKSEPNLEWSILRKPKSHVAFNLPILKGFVKVDVLEPVGGAIAEVQGMLAGRRKATIFLEMYDYWLAEAKRP